MYSAPRIVKRALRAAGLLLGCGLAASAWAGPGPGPKDELKPVSIPLGAGQTLRAFWWPAEGSGRQPAVMALHGCGGLYSPSGALTKRYSETASRLHDAGYGVLLLDSFGSRGATQVCQTRHKERSVHVSRRVEDARAALRWLAAQPKVDARRLGVQGWSNGATTTLTLLAERRAKPEAGEPAIAGAAVFYPGCKVLRDRRANLEAVPLLMQLGALDDWTPPQPCIDLAHALQAQPGRDVSLKVYEGSYHGFDGTAPVRVRTDVPASNRADPEAPGAHQGGNPEARIQSIAALTAFWARVLGTRTSEPAPSTSRETSRP